MELLLELGSKMTSFQKWGRSYNLVFVWIETCLALVWVSIIYFLGGGSKCDFVVFGPIIVWLACMDRK